MFYYSNGYLSNIVEKEIQSTKLQVDISDVSKSKVDAKTLCEIDFEMPIIVIVDKITYLPDEKLFGLVLLDGHEYVHAVLEQKKNSMLSETQLNQNGLEIEPIKDKMPKIDARSIILIRAFKCFILKLEEDNIFDSILLINFTVIGELQENSVPTELADKQIIVKDNDSNINSISRISTALNNTPWSITLLLVKKTPIKEFLNKDGKYIRFQFTDKTGCLEATVFNDNCVKFNEMEVNRVYTLFDTTVKVAKPSCVAFNDLGRIEYELNFNSKAYFKEEVSLLPSEYTYVYRPTEGTNDNVRPSNMIKFTLLDQLILMKPNTFVNVIGIIAEIHLVERIQPKDKYPINKRSVIIVDKSGKTINVAFWGKQADNFDIPKDSIVMLKNVRVSNYGLVSLVFMLNSSLEILQKDLNENIKNLYDYYHNVFLTKNQNFSTNKLIKRNTSKSFEEDEKSLKKNKENI